MVSRVFVLLLSIEALSGSRQNTGDLTLAKKGGACTVQESGTCQPGNEAPCCAEGLECMYSYKGRFCDKIRGWYPTTWVQKQPAGHSPQMLNRIVPYWKLLDANVSVDGLNVRVHYEGGSQLLTQGPNRDWEAFSAISWWDPGSERRNTEFGRTPGVVLKMQCGGSTSRPTRDGAVNRVLSGVQSPGKPTTGENAWRHTKDETVEHHQEVLRYAVELADALNALDTTKLSGGRKLYRGAWHSMADILYFQELISSGAPLVHPTFMSSSVMREHAVEFAHPMYCRGCTEGFCKICPNKDEAAVLFEIDTSYSKELRNVAGNMWESEFIMLPGTPLRLVSVEVQGNDAVPGVPESEWSGRPLRGRRGMRGGYIVNEQPEYYLVKLQDFSAE